MSAGSDYVRHLAELRGTIEARDIRPGDVIMRRCEGETERTPHTVVESLPSPGQVILTMSDGCVSPHSSHMPLSLVSLSDSAELTAWQIGGAL